MQKILETLNTLTDGSSTAQSLGAFNNLYDEAPEIYDILCDTISYDQALFEKATDNVEGPVLEVGCRTGRLTVPLSMRGVEMVGVDKSLALIRRAVSRADDAGASIKFYCVDDRLMKLGRQFNLAILSNNHINEFVDSRDLEKSLESIRNHLNPGGKLIISSSNANGKVFPDGKVIDYSKSTELLISGSETYSKCKLIWSAIPYDFKTQLNLAQIIQSGPEGGQDKLYQLIHRIYYPAELTAILNRCGYEVESVHGDHEGAEWSLQSRSTVVTCIRTS